MEKRNENRIQNKIEKLENVIEEVESNKNKNININNYGESISLTVIQGWSSIKFMRSFIGIVLSSEIIFNSS